MRQQCGNLGKIYILYISYILWKSLSQEANVQTTVHCFNSSKHTVRTTDFKEFSACITNYTDKH